MKYILQIVFLLIFFYSISVNAHTDIEHFKEYVDEFKRNLYSEEQKIKDILEKINQVSLNDTNSIFRLKYELLKFEYEFTYGEIQSSKSSLSLLLNNLKYYDDNIKALYYNDIASIYSSYKMYDLNEQYLRKILNLPKLKRNDKEYIKALSGLSNIYREKNEMDSAKFYILESLYLLSELNTPSLYGSSLQFLANIYFSKYDPDSAYYFVQKYDNKKYKNRSEYLLYYYNSLSYYHYLKNNLDSAIYYSRLSLHNRYKAKDPIMRFSGLTNLGNMFMLNQQYDSAQYYLELGRDSLRSTKRTYLIKLNASLLEELYTKTNNKENLELITSYKYVIDSVNRIQINKINLITKLYETSAKLEESTQKNQEYENFIYTLVILISIITILILFTIYYSIKLKKLLKIQDALITDKLKTLKELEIEINNKNRLISILSHDLINPINSSKQLLEILKEDFNKMEKEEVYEIVTELSRASKNTFFLLKDILNWMKISNNKVYSFNLTNNKIFNLVQNIYEYLHLQLENKEQKFINNLDKDIVLNIDANLMSTIIRNLLTNSSKYSDRQKEIKIYNKTVENKFIIFIEDQGFGMKKELLLMLNNYSTDPLTHKYNDSENSFGYGLLICRDFMKLHNGKMEFDSELNVGTIVKLIFDNDIVIK